MCCWLDSELCQRSSSWTIELSERSLFRQNVYIYVYIYIYIYIYKYKNIETDVDNEGWWQLIVKVADVFWYLVNIIDDC